MVSIIVPVYKVEAYLEKCIKSVQKQTYENLAIILVNCRIFVTKGLIVQTAIKLCLWTAMVLFIRV